MSPPLDRDLTQNLIKWSIKHPYKDMTGVTDPTLQVAVHVDTKSISLFRISSTLDFILFQILVHD